MGPVNVAGASPVGTVVAGDVGGLNLHFKQRKPARAKGPQLTPDGAQEKRAAIREAARGDLEAQRWGSAAETLESNAVILGDPVTLIEAGDARLRLADRDRSIDEAERSIETTRVAIDILHFYRSVAAGQAESDWLVIDPDDTNPHLARAAEQMAAAQTLIEEIERERLGDDAVSDAGVRGKKRDRTARPGTAMIASGAVLSAVGVAGITMVIAGVARGASRQSQVEDLEPGVDDDEIARLDGEGARANRLAFIGTGLAVAGLAVGIPLVVFGVKKRRAAGTRTADLRVLPTMGPALQGVTISGRF